MATLPGPFLIGKNTVLMSVTPQIISADGTTLSDDTVNSFSLLGYWDSTSFENRPRTENIKSANAGYENEVIISDGHTVTLVEILPANGNGKLYKGCATHDYFKVSWQAAPNAGTGTVGLTYTVYGVRTGLREDRNEGKSTATLTLGPCGTPPASA